jgi:hypothetical protein
LHPGRRIWSRLRRRIARRHRRESEADPRLTVEEVLRDIGLDAEAPASSNNPGEGRRVSAEEAPPNPWR